MSAVLLATASRAVATVPFPDTVIFYHNGSLSLNGNDIVKAPQFKSKTRARLYSAGYTALPILLARGMSIGYRLSDQSASSLLLITSGIIVGPSGGSLYADDWNLARRSILIRSVCTAFIIAGHFARNKDNEFSEDAALVMQVSSGLFLAGHALYDIFFLSAHSVEYYNLRIRMETGLSINNSVPAEWKYWAEIPSQKDLKRLPELTVRLFF